MTRTLANNLRTQEADHHHNFSGYLGPSNYGISTITHRVYCAIHAHWPPLLPIFLPSSRAVHSGILMTELARRSVQNPTAGRG